MVMLRLAFLALLVVCAWPARLVAQSAAAPRLVVPDVADVTIKTRRTSDGRAAPVVTQVLHLKGARQRREDRVEVPPEGGPPNWAFGGPAFASISQCDERRTLLLNHEAKTYAYEPIEDPAAHLARMKDDSSRQTPSPHAASPQTPADPTFTMTIDAVDTGERKPFGRYVARHVITTRTVERGPGDVTVSRQDGWYIDLPASNCMASEVKTMFFAAVPPDGAARPNVVVKWRGDARIGYAIEETHQFGGQYASVTRTELVEFSDAPLDDALFTVPPGYRPALPSPYGGYDLSKPDTIANRIQTYREVAAAWVDHIRRYGFRGILPGTQPPARY